MKRFIFLGGLSAALLWGTTISTTINSITNAVTGTGSASANTSSTGASGSASGTVSIAGYTFGGSADFNALFDKYKVGPVFYTDNSFDVTDVDKTYLTTKIANKPFMVELKSENPYVGIVRVDIIKNPANQNECENNPALSSRYAIVIPLIKTIIGDNYPEIIKDAKFRVKYLNKFPVSCVYLMKPNPELNASYVTQCMNDLENGANINVKNCISNLSSNPTPQQVIQCIFNNANSSCSSDDFAVRPDHFNIAVTSPQPIKAGNDFNVTLTAVDAENNILKDYNQTVTIRDVSALLDYVDANASRGAVTGNLNFASSEHKFVNGEANITLKYSEVGDLNLTIKENNDSNEYASVDENDTDINQLLITSASTLIKFIPDHFDVNATYSNFNNADYTYISSDLNMSSLLGVTITAKNENNQTTENYKSGLYAKNVVLNITHSDVDSDKLPLIKISYKNGADTNTSDINSSKSIEAPYSSTNFNNGVANLEMKINFDKNYTTPVNPFDFEIKNVEVVEPVDGLDNNISVNKSATFRYGRIEIQGSSIYGNSINTAVKYEYWTDNKGWVLNKEHNTDTMGSVYLSKTYKPSTINITSGGLINGVETLNISTTHALPYSAKIHLAIPSWLWYHPLAKNYQDPSSSNTDCLTHPCTNDSFLTTSTGWAGISGINIQEFNASKRTAKVDYNNTKDEDTEKGLNKLNW